MTRNGGWLNAVTAVCAVISAAAFAETNYWCGASGNWSEAANWTTTAGSHAVPGEGDVASFPKVTAGYTVNVDQDATVKYVRCEGGDASGKVTLTGSGVLSAVGNDSAPSFTCYSSNGGILAFRDIQASIKRINPKGGTVAVEDGAKVTVSVLYQRTANSKLSVSGGSLTLTSVNVGTAVNGIEYTVSGGYLKTKLALGAYGVNLNVSGGVLDVAGFNSNTADDGAKLAVAWTGGTVLWPAGSNWPMSDTTLERDMKFSPKAANAKLILRKNGTKVADVGLLAQSSSPTYEIGGSLFATNDVECSFYTTNHTTVAGRGKIYAGMSFSRRYGPHTFDIDGLYLANYIHFGSTSLTYNFTNGVTFGAWGDWSTISQNGGNYGLMDLNGPITFETTDCFDGATARNILLARTHLTGKPDLTVSGNGSAGIVFNVDESEQTAGSVKVEAGATLELGGRRADLASRECAAVTLKADELTLAAGAKLKLTEGLTTVVVSEAEVADDAVVEVSLTEAPTAATVTGLVTTENDGIDAERFSITGEGATGWSVKTLAGTSFLTDGTTPTLTDAEPFAWTGANGGNWNDAANWYGGAVFANSTASDSAASLYFHGSRNTSTTNDMTGSASGFRGGAGVNRVVFAADCAPCEIHGNTVRLMGIDSHSDYPAVFYANVWRMSSKNPDLEISTTGKGYVLFAGEVECYGGQGNGAIDLAGDARFGGRAQCGSLYFSASGSELTVTRGGSFYLRNDTLLGVSKGTTATIRVREGGVFATGENAYTPTKTVIRHEVDGEFVASNGVAFAKNQTFTGGGSVRFASAANGATAATVTLDGGITLKMGGDWKTVTGENPNTPLALRVVGAATIESAADWTYGPEAGCEDAAEIVADAGSELTFAASEHTAALAGAVMSEGTVNFATGAKVVPGGALATSAASTWTELVRAAEINGSPADNERYDLKLVTNVDGSKSLMIRARVGMRVIVR